MIWENQLFYQNNNLDDIKKYKNAGRKYWHNRYDIIFFILNHIYF
jgi:hypothetical protein